MLTSVSEKHLKQMEFVIENPPGGINQRKYRTIDSISSFLMGVHELWTSKLAYVGVPAILRVT